ncbi:glycosyltransferase [Clostridium sp. UBA7503]|uniref:glycosyltransferase n=1 Tax=Clostridium sp. UBA7503 TaxID=1946377 RepID=UPI003217D934
MLSLCMIVKNEENNLEKCLNNIAEYVEDIVIVDTGSTDDTKKIAKKYTSKVFDFKWCNDFSKARNFSISKASNDWVLILDADEVIYKFDKEKVEKFIQINSKVVGRIKRINPFEDGKEIKRYIERVNRLFNKKYFHYQGTIHEQVASKDGSQYSMKSIDIEADHIGYLNEVIDGTNKLERNINLLINAIKSNPNDPYLYYQIGKSYYRKKDYSKAYESFSKSVELCTDFRFEYTEDLIESYGYALLKCEKYTEAMKLDEYKNYYGDSPDYNFIMGLIYMNNGKFQEAVEYFEKCIGEKEGKIEGINSYQPNYNIGVIYETLGFKEEALGFYQGCGEYLLAKKRIEKMIDKKKEGIENSQMDSKNINEVKNNIQRCIEDNNLVEAKKLLEEAFNATNKDIELYSMKSVVEIMENRLEDAERTLKYSLEINYKNFDILHNMGYLYEIKGQNQLAVDFYTKALLLSESEKMEQELRGHINSIKINAFKTSIIILTYNNLDYNKICIESIRKYTKNNNYEIIVVDNNSKDGTVEWLKEQKDIKVIYNKENLGFPKGCNQGINIANGEEILLLNNDTIVAPGWLENLKECLYSSEYIGAVGPVTNSCPNYQSIPISYASVEEMIEFAEKYNYSEPKKWEERLRLIGYCMLIKKEVIDKVGLLDEIFTPGNFEDDDYSLRMRKAGYKLMLCKNSFIHHFGSASFEKISKEFSELLIRNRKKFFEKWGFDPYHIVDMEKEAADIIISEAQSNANILHIGCAGGATLLKIKSEVPSSNLYGIECCKDVVVHNIHQNNIKFGGIENFKSYVENYFDYIIITKFDTYFNSIEECLLTAKMYIKETGCIFISIPINFEENVNLKKQLEYTLKKLNFNFKTIKVNGQNLLVLNKQMLRLKSNSPLVSVLIPAYNRPEYLKIALESVLNQTYRNIEIIICDDSTTVDVENMIQEYLKQYSNIRYYKNENNLGQFNNDIKLFNLAKGEYINYLMDDDLFERTKIEKMMYYYLKDLNNEIKLVTSYRKLIDDNGLLLEDQDINKCLFENDTIINGTALGDFMVKLNYNCIGEPTTVLFRKADLTEEFGTFDGRKYGCNVDIATWLNLLSTGKAVYIAEPLSYFRIHSGQQLQSIKMKVLGTIDYGHEIISGYKKGFIQKKGDLKKAIKYYLRYAIKVFKQLEDIKVNQEDYRNLIGVTYRIVEIFNRYNTKKDYIKLKFLLRRIEYFNDIDNSMNIIVGDILKGKINEIDIIFVIIKDIIKKEDVVQIVAAALLKVELFNIAIDLFGVACDINFSNPNNLYNYVQALTIANKKEEALKFLNQVKEYEPLVKELKIQIMEAK